ncbi:hypothetical protein SMICM17S_07158 [Streptomyces microflavus]
MSERGAGPLEWRTVGGYTPESVRRASIVHVFPAAAVADMLKAADEAHIKRLNEENERGGEARGVVADVASVLDVDIDHGPGLAGMPITCIAWWSVLRHCATIWSR